eukprot:4702982-Alexandrium_andersonii.AAC.1
MEARDLTVPLYQVWQDCGRRYKNITEVCQLFGDQIFLQNTLSEHSKEPFLPIPVALEFRQR